MRREEDCRRMLPIIFNNPSVIFHTEWKLYGREKHGKIKITIKVKIKFFPCNNLPSLGNGLYGFSVVIHLLEAERNKRENETMRTKEGGQHSYRSDIFQ